MAKQKDPHDIFDRSFKLIIGSLSDRALISLINRLFGVNHPLDAGVKSLNPEQVDKSLKKLQSDTVISIEGKIYVIEEQTTPDKNMAVRMFEYGYARALDGREIEDGIIVLPFPRMIVVYLDVSRAMPDVLTLRLRFPDGTEHDFKVQAVKLLDYRVEDLAERGLGALLPFYIVKLGKAAKEAKSAEDRRKVELEFKELGLKLKEAIEGGRGTGNYDEADTATLLERLAGLVEYVGEGYRTTEVKEMLDTSLMGYGKRLALEYEQKGAEERKRLEQENERLRRENQEVERLRQEVSEVERLRRENQDLKRRLQTA